MIRLERWIRNGVELWCLYNLECEAGRGGATRAASWRVFFLPSQIFGSSDEVWFLLWWLILCKRLLIIIHCKVLLVSEINCLQSIFIKQLKAECWAATTFFGKTSTPFFSILSIPSYTICNKQYTICNSRAYFPLPRLVFDGWRLLSEALFCNRTTCPLITRLRLSQLFCPLLNNWYTFQIDDQNKDKNRQLTNIGYSWTLPWLKNCSVA